MDTTRDAPPQATEGTTLSDQVYEAILSMIVGGHYAVGSKLPTEQALCEEFQVSRPVLRQALKQLREDGVIVSRQGSGSYVQRRPDGAMLDFAPVGSIADIQRTFEFRAAIEGEAAYIAALRRNQNDLDVMSATLTELDRCIRDGELGVEADEAFHAAVCAAADNKYFLAARNAIRSNILVGMDVNRNLSLIGPQERLRLVQSEHYAVIAAIEQGDAETARQAMRDHVENARRRVFDGS
ncbi:MAG: FadR/GntR family transcriptional regulator [Pseudomonadota bacterium]